MIRSHYITLSAYIFFIAIILLALPRSTVPLIDAKAIWHPPKTAISEVLQTCSQQKKIAYNNCVTQIMEKYSAPTQAVIFTGLIQGRGFMSAYQHTSQAVDVARVLVLAADHSDEFYLINGQPRLINVDDNNYLKKLPLTKNSTYLSLLKLHPNVFLSPGNHNFPLIETIDRHGQRFVFSYSLKNGCHACALLGIADVGFDFNQAGRFLGAHLLNIIPADYSAQ